MWQAGDIIAWRGVYRNRIWHALPALVVKDTAQELAFAILPGAACMFEVTYPKGKKSGKRRWDFTDDDWQLAEFSWHTNRVLSVIEPEKCYSIMHFWDHKSAEFLGYYVNFQQPFTRSHCGVDSLDLDLDLIIDPDLSFKWKDEDDYQAAIDHGLISKQWINGIEDAKTEVFEKLEKRAYPFNGAWLDWKPDPQHSNLRLPANWDEL